MDSLTGTGTPTLASVLRTDELWRRPTRLPDYAAENRAFTALARCLTLSSERMLEALTETALTLCRAQSAGVSLLADDGATFYWPAVAGQWTGYVGGGTPRHFGPCGTVLDEGTALLFSHPERYFTYLQAAMPAIEEALLLPFCVDGHAVGTLWIIAHDERRRFDAEDVRIMTNLSAFAAAAHQMTVSASAMRNSDVRYSTLFDALPVAAFVCDRDGVIQRFNRRAAELWGREPRCGVERYCGSLQLYLMDGTQLPHEQSPMVEVLRTGVSASNVEVQIARPDGSRVAVMANFSALTDAHGAIVGSITCFDDITVQVMSARRLAERLELDRIRSEWVRNLIDAQEEERRRVVRELHDETGQYVTGLMLGLQTLDGVCAAEDSIPRLQRLVTGLDAGVRRLARNLRPPALDDFGLITAMAHHLQEWSAQTGVVTDLCSRHCERRLSAPMETSLYRILQEALTNVARHAQARHVSVIIERRDPVVTLIVEDDGCGFVADDAHRQGDAGHFGLTGIRERAALLGGRAAIQSGPGGSTLFVSVPIASAPDPF